MSFRSAWRQFLLYLFAWTLYGLYSSAQTYFRLRARNWTFFSALRYEMSYALVLGIYSPAVVWLALRYPVTGPKRYRNWALHLAACLIFATVTKLTWDALGLDIPNPAMAQMLAKMSAWERLVRSVNSAMDFALAMYWIIVLGIQAIQFYQRYQESKVNAASLERQLVQAQLQALRMQLNPHFLFNTLHAISALVKDEPESAERMIARLSDLLRMALEDAGTQEIPLERELQFLRLYLDIEQMRFGNRLKVSFDVHPDCRTALVPNLLLQPLVENAIRHGIAHSPTGGQVMINVSHDRDTMLLRIADSGAGLRTEFREGVGIGATKARLDRLYGKCQSFELRNSTPSGTEVRIEIPFKPMRSESGLAVTTVAAGQLS